ncbi:MAG TPA: maltotransferase domain-containing protein [Stellaceae bacterium]|nr:maltotransferase domain-containing protein [Stellaceae bacterium]
MGFDTVALLPFHPTGADRNLYAVADHYAVSAALAEGAPVDGAAALGDFLAAARGHGLAVIMDLVVDRVARDGTLARQHPDWVLRDGGAGAFAPLAHDGPAQSSILAYFAGVVRHYLDLGFAGFRCVAAHRVPVASWQALIAGARAQSPDALFCADTLGAPLDAAERLAGAGFDFLFDSLAWWDFRSPWLLEQHEALRRIAPTIGFPESHDTARLAGRLAAAGIGDARLIEAEYRQRYALAATFSSGLLMPIGYEWGWRSPFDPAPACFRPAAEERHFDLAPAIAAVNRMKRRTPVLESNGPLRLLSPPDEPVMALARQDEDATEWVFTVLNRDPATARQIATDALIAIADDRHLLLTEITAAEAAPVSTLRIALEPLETRIFLGRSRPLAAVLADMAPAPHMHPEWRPEARIVIEAVEPLIDNGRYPVKRIVGESLEMTADILRDGHDKLAALLRYRHADEATWRASPMRHIDNDRWGGRFVLERIGRYLVAIEAWTDHFASWRDEVAKKRAAGQDIRLELIEGRALVAAAAARADAADGAAFTALLASLDAADDEEKAALLLSRLVADLVARWPDRSDAVRTPNAFEVIADRPAARFAAWYEMFPRSQGRVPGRSASFDDCIARLPEIAALGFDVVYLVPIHPIGRINRKGRNNAVVAAPGDPGSPYAIGAAEGGHCAVEPALGTLTDFRRFVAAAATLGMEVALDFAVQCAPDHPWIREHPEWFLFRPDGTIKYAENPPKKYQDIVNVDFYNSDRAALWRALRDIILFWAAEGVRIFRVDNPHTKPVPFWEWCIREVQDQYPDIIFLSEAFTRPKMMKLLAKAGFTQSYSYFTWRNTKWELTQYLTELTRGPEREYMRPNFFTNTPDILPQILQLGGRPAFRTRLVLAATLSPAYGIYNGFELCENTAIPGTEEYLHSEKYEYKVWDWDRPGNIKAEIAALNRFRRANPALALFTNLTFCPADDDNILAYVKLTPDRANIVVAILNLDPFAPHEATVELPLHEMGFPWDSVLLLEDGLGGMTREWRGAQQRVRLDPAVQPALLARVRRL